MAKHAFVLLLLIAVCLVAAFSATVTASLEEHNGEAGTPPPPAVAELTDSDAAAGAPETAPVEASQAPTQHSAPAQGEHHVAASTTRKKLTTREHTLHVEQLTPSADQKDRDVVLVSIADHTTLHVPMSELHNGNEFADDSFLIFDEDFDPLWYYLMKERDFTDVEWSGCGGKWRPEWSVPFRTTVTTEAAGGASGSAFPTEAELAGAEGFALLKHFLSHHVVCSFSSVSFCSANKQESELLHPRKAVEANFESKNHHFQWAAQFISTLTSSPLSFTVDTPRHIRPNGAVLATEDHRNTSALSSPAAASATSMLEPWCSYHLVYHDTLCTQQISPLLHQGKYHKELKEETINGLPEKLIFNNVIASLFDFFATPFHHFHFSVKRYARPDGGVDVEVITRMTFVVDEPKQQGRLLLHWQQSLHHDKKTEAQRQLFDRLSVYVGEGGVPTAMRAALPKEKVRLDLSTSTHGKATLGESGSLLNQPEVTYEVRSIGKDHGYYSVYLNPARTFLQEREEVSGGADQDPAMGASQRKTPLRVGDEVKALLMFPLHLLRPRFYNFESFLGTSVLENFYVDKESNTLVVLVRTPITADHVRAFNATFTDTPPSKQSTGKPNPHERNHEHPLLLLARFQFQHGWGALKDVPRDANRFSIVPQPIVKLERLMPMEKEAAATADGARAAGQCADVCHRAGLQAEFLAKDGARHTMFVDHQKSLLKMMHALSRRSLSPAPPVAPDQCLCHRTLRSALSAGSFLPTPDAAMVFNVLALGLTFASLSMSFFFRSFRKLNCRSKDLLFVERGVIAEELPQENAKEGKCKK